MSAVSLKHAGVWGSSGGSPFVLFVMVAVVMVALLAVLIVVVVVVVTSTDFEWSSMLPQVHKLP